MEQNNKAQQNEDSTELLKMVIRIISIYKNAIKEVKTIESDDPISRIKKDILLPYMVLTYGKALSAYRLLNGYSLMDLHPSVQGVSNDTFTIFDVVRALYECCLQSSFLIKRYQSEDEIQYMARWWYCRAYSERALLAKNRSMSNDQLEEEAKQMNDYKLDIANIYGSISDIDKQEFGFDKLTGLAKWPTPGKLYQIVGIHKSQHDHIYKYYSIYAHCEPLSMLQVSDAFRKGDVDVNISIVTQGVYVLQLLVLSLRYMSLAFPELDVFVKKRPGFDVFLVSAEVFWARSIEEARKASTLRNSRF